MAIFGRFLNTVTKKLLKDASIIIGNKMADAGEAEAIVLKQRLIDAIIDSPVCQELRDKTTPSSFVPSKSGTATLFGYLGMDEGSDPVGDLVEFLEEAITIKSKRRFIIGQKIATTLKIPSKDEMNSHGSLQHPRLGLAWPVILEEGLTGLANSSFFLQTPPAKTGGESGLGIQIKKKTRGSVGKIPFLSTIFKDFRARFGGK